MARASGRLVMTGHIDKEYSMAIVFSDGIMPHQLRKGGYYLGQKTCMAMIEVLSKVSGLQSTGASTGVEENKPYISVENRATASTDELRNVESQCSTKSSKRATPGSNSPHTAMVPEEEVPEEETPEEEAPEEEAPEEEVPEEETPEEEAPEEEAPEEEVPEEEFPEEEVSEEEVPEEEFPEEEFPEEEVSEEEVPEGFQSVVRPYRKKRLRSLGRAPDFLSRSSSEEEDEFEITEVDEYTIFIGDQSNPVSLCVLPLEFGDQELIASGGSVSTSEVSLLGKSGGSDVMRSITAWKLAFPETESFHILVKITQTSDAKRWVKLEKPRSGYKETAEDVFCVAKFLAFLKKEPHASEDRVRKHLLEGDIFSVAFCDHLRKQCSLMEQYIDLDPALKEADARKILLSLTREKVSNAGKRMLLVNDGSSDEDDYPRVKKPKMDLIKAEVVSMREYESEEEFYEDEGMDDEDDKFDDEPGESVCIFCDDGGLLLCCDGPCMRSFHPRPNDGSKSKCKSLGYRDGTELEELKKDWFCKNCEIKKHQCYVCGELGDSDEALGPRRQVFVCDVASCGKFYHPWCVASKLKPTAGEREALVKGIRAGEESFTCPLHMCKKCGRVEEKREKDLNLATCRRCPAAWHIKCLPRTLRFIGDEESNFEVRAWKLSKQFIVYCTDHEILRDLCTPQRNHIKFPEATKGNIHIKEKIPEATKIVEKPQKKVSTVGKERPGFRAKVSSSAVSQILGGSAGTAQPATQDTSGDAAKRLVDDIVAKSRQRITKDDMKKKAYQRLPIVYQREEPAWMLNGRMDSILNGARAAMESLNQGNNWEDAKLKCGRDQVTVITNEEKCLRTFLAPTLFGKRYTSFGRHFTKIEKLQKVVETLQPYIWDEDTIVDFCCGDNSFSRLLYDTLSNAGKTNCKYKNFDLFSPKDTFGFERKDWFNVTKGDCGPGDNLVIGLNPPFPYADMFVSHALTMNPRILVLIVPLLKKSWLDYGYVRLLDDHTTMANKSFYLPGSVDGSNDECVEQGNWEAPHLYIYVQKKFFEPSKAEPSAANPSQQMHQNRESEKPVKPAKPTPPSDENLFIRRNRSHDPRPVSARSQHMPNRMSEAMSPRSQIEEGEILPPPPPGSPPPFQLRVFHDGPHHYPLQISPRFRPHHHSEFPPPHDSQDEYNPFEPGLVPLGGPRGLPRHDPRGSSPASGFPPSPHPGLPLRNVGPPRPQNQQFHHAPSTSRGPLYSPGMHFQGYDDNESGGWLDR